MDFGQKNGVLGGVPLTQCYIVQRSLTIWLLSIALMIEGYEITRRKGCENSNTNENNHNEILKEVTHYERKKRLDTFDFL